MIFTREEMVAAAIMAGVMAVVLWAIPIIWRALRSTAEYRVWWNQIEGTQALIERERAILVSRRA
jgi:hypothetical protein